MVSVDKPDISRESMNSGKLKTKEDKKSPDAPAKVAINRAGILPIQSDK